MKSRKKIEEYESTKILSVFLYFTDHLVFSLGIYHCFGWLSDSKTPRVVHTFLFSSWFGAVCIFRGLFRTFHSSKLHFDKNRIQKRNHFRIMHYGIGLSVVLPCVFLPWVWHFYVGLFYFSWRHDHFASSSKSICRCFGNGRWCVEPIESITSFQLIGNSHCSSCWGIVYIKR